MHLNEKKTIIKEKKLNTYMILANKCFYLILQYFIFDFPSISYVHAECVYDVTSANILEAVPGPDDSC